MGVSKYRKYWKYVLLGIVFVFLSVFLAPRIYFNYPGKLMVSANQGEDVNYSFKVIADNLDTPWAIDFLPDGTMIFTERPGRVNLLLSGKVVTVANISVDERGESGLMGLAVDPDFSQTKQIYVYYTYSQANRVSKFTLVNNSLMNETILLDNIPRARFHDGGRLEFGPDDKLYITTGDATLPSSAQDLDSLAGKILRMNKDGSIPLDNPFSSLVYSYGHRNPQGLTWDDRGELYSTEHGPTRNDEFNQIVKGGNYGWPQECTEKGKFINPLRCFTEFTLAPGGLVFHQGDFFVAGLRGNQLRRLVWNPSNSSISYEQKLFADLGRIREVTAYQGFLYVATSNYDGRGIPQYEDDKIMRVQLK